MAETPTLRRGDEVPHLEVQTIDGGLFRYAAIWQRRNLVLLALPQADGDEDYVGNVRARAHDFDAHNSACVITRQPVPGLPAPGALVADRWGEIVYVATSPQVAGLPPPQALLDWAEHLEHRCPECEGESR
ncbi:MAG: hypothetical protein IT176_15485 [Acidobacteria bacterium]|nr:hypothetical protein [Acidobacteriota bacterium]